MTDLIHEQIITTAVMIACGITAGLVFEILNLFEKQLLKNFKYSKLIIYVLACLIISYLIGEYLYFCENGKLTFYGIVSFFIGLLLWYKYFCVIISSGRKE